MPNAQRASCAWEPDGSSMVQLRHISEPNIAQDQHGETSALFGLGPRAFGFSDDAEPSFKITFNVPWVKGGASAQEYDWISAARAKTEGTFYYAKGTTVDSYPSKVAMAEQSTDAKGETRVAVTLLALYCVPG